MLEDEPKIGLARDDINLAAGPCRRMAPAEGGKLACKAAERLPGLLSGSLATYLHHLTLWTGMPTRGRPRLDLTMPTKADRSMVASCTNSFACNWACLRLLGAPWRFRVLDALLCAPNVPKCFCCWFFSYLGKSSSLCDRVGQQLLQANWLMHSSYRWNAEPPHTWQASIFLVSHTALGVCAHTIKSYPSANSDHIKQVRPGCSPNVILHI